MILYSLRLRSVRGERTSSLERDEPFQPSEVFRHDGELWAVVSERNDGSTGDAECRSVDVVHSV